MFFEKKELTLETCKMIMQRAEEKAGEMGVYVSIAVVDSSGALKGFSRMDGSTNCSMEIAMAKAKHAINYRRTTKYHEDIVQKGGLVAMAFPGFMPIEGGIPIVHQGEYVGAIGISGAQSEQDGEIATYASAMETIVRMG